MGQINDTRVETGVQRPHSGRNCGCDECWEKVRTTLKELREELEAGKCREAKQAETIRRLQSKLEQAAIDKAAALAHETAKVEDLDTVRNAQKVRIDTLNRALEHARNRENKYIQEAHDQEESIRALEQRSEEEHEQVRTLIAENVALRKDRTTCEETIEALRSAMREKDDELVRLQGVDKEAIRWATESGQAAAENHMLLQILDRVTRLADRVCDEAAT